MPRWYVINQHRYQFKDATTLKFRILLMFVLPSRADRAFCLIMFRLSRIYKFDSTRARVRSRQEPLYKVCFCAIRAVIRYYFDETSIFFPDGKTHLDVCLESHIYWLLIPDRKTVIAAWQHNYSEVIQLTIQNKYCSIRIGSPWDGVNES